MQGTELVFVDPYLNPCEPRAADVIRALLQFAAGTRSKCSTAILYARKDDVLPQVRKGDGRFGNLTIGDVKDSLHRLVKVVETTKPFKLFYYLLNDSQSKDRMHDRYLMCVKGGIELSQGFQVLSVDFRARLSQLFADFPRNSHPPTRERN